MSFIRSSVRTLNVIGRRSRFPKSIVLPQERLITRQYTSTTPLNNSIESKYREAAAALNSPNAPKVDASNETKLKLYALFKQAEQGPCTGSRPGMFDMINRAKYDAWKSLETMNKEDAMKEYTQTIVDMFGGTLPTVAATATASTAASPAATITATATAVSSAPLYQPRTKLGQVWNPRSSQSDQLTSHFQCITLQVEDTTGIATITLNRPKKGNAFNIPLLEELRLTSELLMEEDRVRVIILQGAGDSFTSGMDLSVFMEMQGMLGQDTCEARRREKLLAFIDYLQKIVTAIELLPVPVLCAIHGAAIGGAIDLLCATDLRYATKDANFSVKEVDLAIIADMGTLQRLPKLIGLQKAMELSYTGRHFNGLEAEKMGLVVKGDFANKEEMMTHVRSVAEEIAKKSPLTIRGIKKSLLYSRDHTVADSLEQVRLYNASMVISNDLLTAAQAMMQKKVPEFKETF